MDPKRILLVEDETDILDLLESPQERETIGTAGRQYVEHYQTWDSAAALFEQLYRRALRPVATA